MTTTRPVSAPETICSCCGSIDGPLDDEYGYCADCETRRLETDSTTAEAIADILHGAVKAAMLNIDGEDIRRIVGEAVREEDEARTRAGLTRHVSIATLEQRLHRRMGERIAAREAVAA